MEFSDESAVCSGSKWCHAPHAKVISLAKCTATLGFRRLQRSNSVAQNGTLCDRFLKNLPICPIVLSPGPSPKPLNEPVGCVLKDAP